MLSNGAAKKLKQRKQRRRSLPVNTSSWQRICTRNKRKTVGSGVFYAVRTGAICLLLTAIGLMPGGSVYKDHTFNKETEHTSHEFSQYMNIHSTIQYIYISTTT
jgi:hypothetical protein